MNVEYLLNHFGGLIYIYLTRSSWISERFLTLFTLPFCIYSGTAKWFNLSPREEITKNWGHFRVVILDLLLCYESFWESAENYGMYRIQMKLTHPHTHSPTAACKFLRFSNPLNLIHKLVLESLRGITCLGRQNPEQNEVVMSVWLLEFSFMLLRLYSFFPMEKREHIQPYQSIFMLLLNAE